MGSFALSIYSDLLTSLHCSVCKTGVILAKPITMLAIIDYIDKELTENRIDFEGLYKYYKLESAQYNNKKLVLSTIPISLILILFSFQRRVLSSKMEGNKS